MLSELELRVRISAQDRNAFKVNCNVIGEFEKANGLLLSTVMSRWSHIESVDNSLDKNFGLIEGVWRFENR